MLTKLETIPMQGNYRQNKKAQIKNTNPTFGMKVTTCHFPSRAIEDSLDFQAKFLRKMSGASGVRANMRELFNLITAVARKPRGTSMDEAALSVEPSLQLVHGQHLGYRVSAHFPDGKKVSLSNLEPDVAIYGHTLETQGAVGERQESLTECINRRLDDLQRLYNEGTK